MSQRLVFGDAQAAADLVTFAARAARLGGAAVRLQASAGTLAVTTAVLAPQTLLDPTPTVLAMRILEVDPELECDLGVEASALTAVIGDTTAVALPETAVAPGWMGLSPPRSGWVPELPLSASTLATRAQWGISAVADALPRDAGDDAVRATRAAVWGRPDVDLHDLPLGVAFAAFALGFIGGDEQAQVLTSAPWTRVTLRRGHVVTRARIAAGLTPVRRTGST